MMLAFLISCQAMIASIEDTAECWQWFPPREESVL
jgi:hypothetical protein